MMVLPAFLAAGALRQGIARWWKLGAGVLLGALLIMPLGYCKGRGDGQRIERAAWQHQADRIRLAAEQTARAADMLRGESRAGADKRISDERKEVDHASESIPDRAVTDRQRSRACIELRRQAARRGAAVPAC